MKSRRIDSDIKELKSFLEFWGKLHSFYEETIGKGVISADDETRFLQTKALIRDKYEALKENLEFKYAPHTRLTDPVSDVLGVENIRFMSEQNLKKTANNWRDSYIFLNSILERLDNNRRRKAEQSPFGGFFKKIFKGRDS